MEPVGDINKRSSLVAQAGCGPMRAGLAWWYRCYPSDHVVSILETSHRVQRGGSGTLGS